MMCYGIRPNLRGDGEGRVLTIGFLQDYFAASFQAKSSQILSQGRIIPIAGGSESETRLKRG